MAADALAAAWRRLVREGLLQVQTEELAISHLFAAEKDPTKVKELVSNMTVVHHVFKDASCTTERSAYSLAAKSQPRH